MKRLLISSILALALLVVPVSGVFALSSEEVTITATPIYLDITTSPDAWPIGNVAEGTTYWWAGTPPTFPLDAGSCTSVLTNNSSVSVNITITGPNPWVSSGAVWTLVASSPGADEVVLDAGIIGDNDADLVNLTTSAQAFISTLAAAATEEWEISLETGTFTHGNLQTGAVTLSATAA